MAVKIEGDIDRGGGNGSIRKYNWEKWFDGDQWLLSQGVDFEVFPGSFRSMAAMAAKNRGFKLATRMTEDSEGRPAIRIQAYSPDHK